LKINLFIPCFVDQLFPSVGISAVRIFEKLGHAVDFKESILCCGQPAFNAGYWEETRGIARRVLEFLAGSDPVVVPSGSCAAMVKNFYPELFRETPQADAATEITPVLSRSSRARVGPATSSEFWSWGPMAPRTLR
jgi:L-lactate dehydrogenase complex protein LldE